MFRNIFPFTSFSDQLPSFCVIWHLKWIQEVPHKIPTRLCNSGWILFQHYFESYTVNHWFMELTYTPFSCKIMNSDLQNKLLTSWWTFSNRANNHQEHWHRRYTINNTCSSRKGSISGCREPWLTYVRCGRRRRKNSDAKLCLRTSTVSIRSRQPCYPIDYVDTVAQPSN